MTPCPACGTFDWIGHPDTPIRIPPGLPDCLQQRLVRFVAAELMDRLYISNVLPLHEILGVPSGSHHLETLQAWLQPLGQHSINQIVTFYGQALQHWDNPQSDGL